MGMRILVGTPQPRQGGVRRCSSGGPRLLPNWVPPPRGSGATGKRPRTSGREGSGAGGVGPASSGGDGLSADGAGISAAAAGGAGHSVAAAGGAGTSVAAADGAGTSAAAAGGAGTSAAAPVRGSGMAGGAAVNASQRSDRVGRTPSDEELDPWTEEVLSNAEAGLVRGMFGEKVNYARPCKVCRTKISWKESSTSAGKRHLKRSHYTSLQIWCRRFKDLNKPDNLTFPDGGWGPEVPDNTAWPWEHAATWPRISSTPEGTPASAVTGDAAAGGDRQMNMGAFAVPRVHGQQLREGLVQLFAAADLPFRLVECREVSDAVLLSLFILGLLIPSHHLCSSSHPTISAPNPMPPSLLLIPSHHLCSSSHPTISALHPIPPSLLLIPSHHLCSSSHPTISAPFTDIHTTIPAFLFASTAYGEAAREDMRQLLVGDGLAGRMSLTFDIWTGENNVAFVAVTCHYVTSDFQLKQAVIDFRELKGSHTGDLIADELEEVLREWGLEKMLFAVTCDNAENNSRAMRLLAGVPYARPGSRPRHPPLLSRWRHFGCVAHVVNLAVQAALKVDEVAEPLKRLRDVANYIGWSTLRTDRFFELQKGYAATRPQGPPGSRRASGPLRLIVDSPTRWGSTLNMVNRGFELRMPIAMFFDDSEVPLNPTSIFTTHVLSHPIPPSLLLIPCHHLCSSSHATISAPHPTPPSLLLIPRHHACSSSHATMSAPHPTPPCLLLIPCHPLCSSSHPTISAPDPMPCHHLCSSSHATISAPHPMPPSLLLIPRHHVCSSSHATMSAPYPPPPCLLLIPCHPLCSSSHPTISAPHPMPCHHLCSSSHATISAPHPMPPKPYLHLYNPCDPFQPSISKETRKAWDAIRLTDAHWDDLAELRDFLTPFEQEKAQLTPGISPLRSSLITAAMGKLERHMGGVSEEAAIATFLDPRQKVAPFKHRARAAEGNLRGATLELGPDRVKALVRARLPEYQAASTTAQGDGGEVTSARGAGVHASAGGGAVDASANVSIQSQLFTPWDAMEAEEGEDPQDEVDQYLAEGRQRGGSALEYWRSRETLKGLRAMARDYLGVPASSAASERAFSKSRNIITWQRHRLAAGQLRASMLIKTWQDHHPLGTLAPKGTSTANPTLGVEDESRGL
ncbi:unnamed protein product [Closterium sp. Naga37s-1]|nr:unnamed protein product [Closterium sp. Naga37s-1]